MNYPTSNQIDPEEARYLYENHCAIFILENLPTGSEFGIDLATYRVGEKFKGVKLIPPGVHFVYACAVDRSNKQTLGPRCGFFHEFREKEISIKKWSTTDEEFDDSFRPDEEYLTRYSDNLRDLDGFLGPYNFCTYEDYKNLTSLLTSSIVGELVPDCQSLRSIPYLTRQGDTPASSQNRIPRASLIPPKPSEKTLVPDLKPDPKTVIHFTNIPTNHLDSKQTIALDQITLYNLDTTLKLGHCFPGSLGCNRLLAEFQFAFVTFLLCHIYECFEHWKSILTLIKHIPEDLFEDIVDSNNLVRNHIDIFLQNIHAHGERIDNDLKTKASDLKNNLMEKFGWKFDLDDDEDQPVVVEL